MSESERNVMNREFATALQNNDKSGAMGVLRKAFINAVELKIETKITKGTNEQISTTINLLSGDIHTSLHEVFAEDREKIAQFHQGQVKKAEEIIATNLKILRDLTDAVRDLFVS
jgi:hypothetical protein